VPRSRRKGQGNDGQGNEKNGAGCLPPVLIPFSPIPLPNISLPHIRFPRWTEEETPSCRDAEPPRNPSASLREFPFPAGGRGTSPRLRPWLTLTHTQRWQAHRHRIGSGRVYQGRFKSLPVQEDEHFYTVCRYVERNALRANLAPGAERWRGGSLHRWKPRYGEGKGVVGGVALAALAGRGRARQRTANRGGVGGAAPWRATRQSVRRGELGATGSSADWDWKARFAPKAAPKNSKTVPDAVSSHLLFGAVSSQPCCSKRGGQAATGWPWPPHAPARE
jgi:hypothetical protein